MTTAEFQAEVVDGKITVPAALAEQLPPRVHVLVFVPGAEKDSSNWPAENRRRWELILKKTSQTLTLAEEEELVGLQRLADERLEHVGPRPTEHLEQLYAELMRGT